jgi:ADP-ribose pyrophosphatase YjhB (NUDIX family)
LGDWSIHAGFNHHRLSVITKRTDYYNDPSAPPPNSLVPASSAVVANAAGDILLQRRRDNDLWALPGGAMELGETIIQSVVREVEEETGLRVKITGLVGLYSDPRHVIAYADGEVRQQFNVCFQASVVAGTLRLSDESSLVEFVSRDRFDDLPMHPTTRLRIDHYFENRDEPYLG